MKLPEFLGGAIGVVLMIGMVIYGLAQMWVGWHGIEHHLGAFWAWVAFGVSLFGFTLPLSIGSFFGMTDVYGWGTLSAAIFAFPAIILWLGLVLASFGKGR